MDERDIKDIYAIFVGFTIVILFYGTSFNTIMQIMNILATTNISVITNISMTSTLLNITSIHIPFYIEIVITILLIPMIIDVCYDMINMSKIVKTQDEELGEILKAFIRILFILITTLLLIFS